MEASKRTINDIFNGSRILEVPFFQRAYVWGEDQWERLLEDIENVSQSNDSYFMGPVILKQQLTQTVGGFGDIRTIIDGQQRLTTLSIVLKVICLKNNNLNPFIKRFQLDNNSNVLRHNRIDLNSYNRIMDLNEEITIDGQDNITQAYNYFCNEIDLDKVNFDAITNKLLFVVIDLASDEDEQQIFDSINSLGVKLTTAELLKNYFFNRDDITSYNKYWRDVFELDPETRSYWDKEISAGRLKRSFIDLFFYSFLQIKIQEFQSTMSSEDKIVFSKVDRLFDSYKKFISKYNESDKLSMREEIRTYAEIFKTTFDPDIIYKDLPENENISRINAIIFGLEVTTLIPYILYVERNLNDLNAKNELYEVIETYIMRRLVTRANNKNYNRLFTDQLIQNKILTKQDFLQLVEKLEDKVNHLPSEKQVEEAFNNNILSNKNATGVLYLIESKIRNQSLYSNRLLGMNKYSLEHVMPKKWRNQWDGPKDLESISIRDKKLLTLGNLTIITQALNSSIRDSDWNTKKEGRGPGKFGLKQYSNGLDTFSQYLEREIWDENIIEERAEFLFKKAMQVWKI